MDITGYTPACFYPGCGANCGMSGQRGAWNYHGHWYCSRHYYKLLDDEKREIKNHQA